MQDINNKEIGIGNRIAYMTNGADELNLGTIVKIKGEKISILGDGNSRLGTTTFPHRIVVLENTSVKNTVLGDCSTILNPLVKTGPFVPEPGNDFIPQTQKSIDFIHLEHHAMFKDYFLYGFNYDKIIEFIAVYIQERELMDAIKQVHSFSIIAGDPTRSIHDPKLDQCEMAFMFCLYYT